MTGTAAPQGMPVSVPDEARLARTVMQTLGPPERPSLPRAEGLYHGQASRPGLREARFLLVLHGWEHLLRDCASLMRRLLRHRPRHVRQCPKLVR